MQCFIAPITLLIELVRIPFYLGCVAEVAHSFTNVLHHCYVILPAVVPELRGRELPPQKNCHT